MVCITAGATDFPIMTARIAKMTEHLIGVVPFFATTMASMIL
jgi:hypothetical protein